MRRKPIAQQLSLALGGVWKAVREPGEFGWHWKCEDGRWVRAYAQFSPQWDGDDETWTTVYIDNKGRTVGYRGVITCGSLFLPQENKQ